MAVPVRSRPERVYVNVVLSVDSTGFMKPSAIRWADGRTFDIERIRDFRPASTAGNDIRKMLICTLRLAITLDIRLFSIGKIKKYAG